MAPSRIGTPSDGTWASSPRQEANAQDRLRRNERTTGGQFNRKPMKYGCFLRCSSSLRKMAKWAILDIIGNGGFMHEVNSTDLKSRFGEYLDMARVEPVQVKRTGRPVAVLMSWEEYEHLQAVEDAYWGARAEAAKRSGTFLSHDDSLALLNDLLHRAK
jgi:prevent-host-death family protein